MKNLKFRAWGGKPDGVKEFVYFSLFGGGIDGDEWVVADEPDGTGGKPTLMVQDIEAVLRYTGFNDKNGKEIYEGDILLTDDQYHDYQDGIAINSLPDGRLVPVQFKDGAFWVEDELLYEFAFSWEVVGNIYENPEFLDNNGSKLEQETQA